MISIIEMTKLELDYDDSNGVVRRGGMREDTTKISFWGYSPKPSLTSGSKGCYNWIWKDIGSKIVQIDNHNILSASVVNLNPTIIVTHL